jgi:hypothetical protein
VRFSDADCRNVVWGWPSAGTALVALIGACCEGAIIDTEHAGAGSAAVSGRPEARQRGYDAVRRYARRWRKERGQSTVGALRQVKPTSSTGATKLSW